MKTPAIPSKFANALDPACLSERHALHLLMHGGPMVRRLYRALQRRRTETTPLPSLRGVPSPDEVKEAWLIHPRTPIDALRIGSRLLDLEPAVDNSFVFEVDSLTGERRIVRREPGIRGWMRMNCPRVGYSTAMRHKKLAARLRSVCGAPANMPLEWLLPGFSGTLPKLSTALRERLQNARQILASLLNEFPSLQKLTKEVERRLKIVRIPKNDKKIPLFALSGRKRRTQRVSSAQKSGQRPSKPRCAPTAAELAAREAARQTRRAVQWHSGAAELVSIAREASTKPVPILLERLLLRVLLQTSASLHVWSVS